MRTAQSIALAIASSWTIGFVAAQGQAPAPPAGGGHAGGGGQGRGVVVQTAAVRGVDRHAGSRSIEM